MPMRDYLLDPSSLASKGATSPVVRTQGYAPEVMRLAAQLTQQRAKAGVGVPKSPQPGVLGRIFDVIQRPLYASANTVNALQKGENPLQGAASGIWGTEKTTYDKVLEDAGLSGGWQRSLLGFGLDVALDPTSYLGLGIEKAVAEGVASKAAVEAGVEATAKHMAPHVVESVADDIYKAGLKSTGIETKASKFAKVEHLEKAGANIGDDLAAQARALKTARETMPETVHGVEETVSKKAAMKQAKEIQHGNVMDDVQRAGDARLAEQRGKVYLKFIGKQTPIASERLYGVGKAVAGGAKAVPGVKGFNEMFRPNALLPQGMNSTVRAAMGHSVADADLNSGIIGRLLGNKVWKVGKGEDQILWGGLSNGERHTLIHGMDTGADLSQHLVESTGKTLEDYAKQLRNRSDFEWGARRDLGLVQDTDKMENFVPMILKGGTPAEQKAFKEGWKAGLPGHTLQDAVNKGLKPIEDPVEAFSHQQVKSMRKIGPARANRAIENEFGTSIDALAADGTITKKQAAKLAKSMDHVPVSAPGFSTKKVYFPPEIADAVKSLNKIHSDPAIASDLLKMFDKVQNTWKLGMTAVNPGHHIRNFAGDVFLNWEDGVKNPARYMDSAKVLKSYLDNPNAVIMKIGNMDLTAGQVMNLFTQHGGKSGFFRLEYALKGQGIGLHPIETIRQWAEKREDWTRLAHFLDVIEKDGSQGKIKNLLDLDKSAKAAGQRVRKFNIDYGDLTPFEQKYMKRIVPFYTWMRKNIPLQLETLAMDPGKIAVIPKGLRALQSIVGASPDEENILGLNIVPKWLREMAGVRIAGEGMGRNQVYWNPTQIPFMDVGTYFGGGPTDVLRQFLSGTSPFIRSPIEQATGRSLNSGAPVGDDTMSYLGSQITPPTLPALWSIAQGKGEPTDVSKLLGGGLYNVGPQQQLGELRRQQDIIQAILKAKKPQRARSWEPGYGQAVQTG